jgi:hypothetical protein
MCAVGRSGKHGCMIANPTFLVVDDDGDTVHALHRDLQRRFGVDYEIRRPSRCTTASPYWKGCATGASRSPS